MRRLNPLNDFWQGLVEALFCALVLAAVIVGGTVLFGGAP